MSFLGLAGGKSFRGTESGLWSQYITVRIQPTTHREFDVGSTERDAFIKNCLWQQFNLFIHQLLGKGKAFLIIEAEITETCGFGGRRNTKARTYRSEPSSWSLGPSLVAGIHKRNTIALIPKSARRVVYLPSVVLALILVRRWADPRRSARGRGWARTRRRRWLRAVKGLDRSRKTLRRIATCDQ